MELIKKKKIKDRTIKNFFSKHQKQKLKKIKKNTKVKKIS